MRIVISSGHGKKIRGASGPPPWGLDEVDQARRVVDRVAAMLDTTEETWVTTFHDDISTTQSENLDRIVAFHNAQSRHLDVSVHFNAYAETSKPMGTEVLYVTQEDLARKVCGTICIAAGFINRGPKLRTDLAFLNGTTEPAILIEVCFVDSQGDVAIYDQPAKFEAICRAIAESISGEQVAPGPEPEPEPEPEPPAQARTLQKGMTGTDVARMQQILGIPADGDFGATTETQVEAFQAACDLDADGIVGPMTWSEVDALEARVRAGGRLTAGMMRQVVERAEASPLMDFKWPDRGISPMGYLPGMALSYAVALDMHQAGDAAATAMAGKLGSDAIDALTWYKNEFAALGMSNNKPGVDVLRHLFVLMIGLGMRESSGCYYEGRDMSADNVAADTCEAGLFQTSWNIASAHKSLPPLLDAFWRDPTGFLPEFGQGLTPVASNLDCYGTGDGATYQWLAKYCPAFAVMTTAVGLRFRRQHWGPINRREVLLTRDADTLLQQIELIDDGAAA